LNKNGIKWFDVPELAEILFEPGREIDLIVIDADLSLKSRVYITNFLNTL